MIINSKANDFRIINGDLQYKKRLYLDKSAPFD